MNYPSSSLIMPSFRIKRCRHRLACSLKWWLIWVSNQLSSPQIRITNECYGKSNGYTWQKLPFLLVFHKATIPKAFRLEYRVSTFNFITTCISQNEKMYMKHSMVCFSHTLALQTSDRSSKLCSLYGGNAYLLSCSCKVRYCSWLGWLLTGHLAHWYSIEMQSSKTSWDSCLKYSLACRLSPSHQSNARTARRSSQWKQDNNQWMSMKLSFHSHDCKKKSSWWHLPSACDTTSNQKVTRWKKRDV